MKMPYRQIHVDFHTSPLIPDVASSFDAGEFTDTLREAHVNSVNLFAKCHHGMYYYPTKLGTQHPGLNGFDLFGAQIRACREAGIRSVAYTCAAWNEDTASRHPEWLCLNREGLRGNKKPFSCGYTSWNTLCINQPDYKALLKQELFEIWDNYRPDGFWIDIVNGYQCVCDHCREEMLLAGMDPENPSDVARHDRMIEIRFCREFYTYLKTLDPKLQVYFNNMPYSLDDAANEAVSSVSKRKYFDFIDIESLPSEDWGYDHFPIAAAYVNKYDAPLTMMNGKFHMSWGDFGSIRSQAALEYECFRALAFGAGCNIGDQMHPTGRLDRNVYRKIGEVYRQVEAKEPWCTGTRPVSEVGVFIASNPVRPEEPSLIENGVYRVLTELHIPFRFLNRKDSFDQCRLLILPDCFVPDAALAKRHDAFTASGGKLLLTGRSGFDPETGSSLLQDLHARFLGKSPYSVRYLRPDPEIFPKILPMDHVLYEPGYCIEPALQEDPAARTIAGIIPPYFERNYRHFCSHRQTPPAPVPAAEAGIFTSGNCICISSPLFTDYMINGYLTHRDLIGRCIGLLLENPLLLTDLPSVTEVTIREKENALIVHLLNYVCRKKCRKLETVEDLYYVPECQIRIRLDEKPETVRLVPEEKDIPFTYSSGYVEITPGMVSGHTMIEIR